MQAWLESIAGPDFAPALMWTIVALIALLILLVLIRIVRGLTFGTFVAGGRNRKARLAVMDATAVDSQRRLVLVRRDDVEHLILIGGPSDVVVEQNIKLLTPAASRRPASDEIEEPAPRAVAAVAQPPRSTEMPAPRPAAPAAQPAVRPEVAARPVVAPPQPIATVAPPAGGRTPPPAPQPVAPARATSSTDYAPPSPARPADDYRTMRPVTPTVSPVAPNPAPTVSVRPAAVAAPVAPTQTYNPAPVQPQKNDLESALLEELQVSLHNDHVSPNASVDLSLDEEMSKLLNDLSVEKQRS